MRLIECTCGAELAPVVIVRDDVGDQFRCPECPHGGLARGVKTALRLPNDHVCGMSGPEVRREFTDAPFGIEISYPENGTPEARGGGADD